MRQADASTKPHRFASESQPRLTAEPTMAGAEFEGRIETAGDPEADDAGRNPGLIARRSASLRPASSPPPITAWTRSPSAIRASRASPTTGQ